MSAEFETTDLTPRFLAFHERARAEPDAERRWELWREAYGFAAVPPTPADQEMARRLLEEAWERYGPALPLIRRGADDLFADAGVQLSRVRTLLQTRARVPLRLVGYVGGFEHNAFVADAGEALHICIPVEMPRQVRLPVLAHELTHAVHLPASGSSGGWPRPLMETILQEGLATRVTQALFPDAPLASLVGEPWWYGACQAGERELLRAMLPHLEDDSEETMMRFVLGPGELGLPREAYYAGWMLVGDLLAQGWTFPHLAHLPVKDACALLRVGFEERLGRR